jgi:hypothetical protein
MSASANAVAEGGRTPEFVRWTLAHACPLREEYRWTDPEQTERLLRPVRAAGDARREGRCLNGIVFHHRPTRDEPIEQVRGFLVEEALAVFGGEGHVAATCGACPANAVSALRATWAGCYGMFYLADAAGFHAAVERALREAQTEEMPALVQTNPPWYGFWLQSPLLPTHAHSLKVILERVVRASPEAAPLLDEFLIGLSASLETQLPMYATLIPSGRLQDGRWRLDSHCRRCKAPRPLGDRMCQVCALPGEVCAGRTRMVQGERPYHPLIRQLGAERLSHLLQAFALQ